MLSAHNYHQSTTCERRQRSVCAPRSHKSPIQDTINEGETPPAPQFEEFADLVLGKPIPSPELDHPDEAQTKFESYFVDNVVDPKHGPGRRSAHSYRYRLSLQGYSPESTLEYRVDEISQCHE